MSLQQDLHHLFLQDQRVRGLESRQATCARRLAAQSKKLDQIHQQVSESHQQLMVTRSHAANIENEAESIGERIETMRQRMNTVTNNKEYQSLLVEVSSLKNEKNRLEKEALQEMERIEQLEAEHQQLEEQSQEQQKVVERAQQELKRAQEEVADQLAQAKQDRQAAAAKLPREALELFEKQNEMHEGEGMAPIELQSRKDMEYICGGCYVMLPLERLNALLSRPNELVLCPSCSRILYAEDELRSTIKAS